MAIMNRNEIWLDGDRYYLTVPRESTLHRIAEAVAWNPELQRFLDNRFVVSADDRSYMRRVYDSHTIMVFDDRISHGSTIVYFHPCLVPMTKNGEIDPSFINTMPDGTIVFGGSFLLNGKEGVNSVYVDPVSPEDIRITNTNNNPVRWLWWDGMMIAMDIGVHMQAEALYDWLLKEIC